MSLPIDEQITFIYTRDLTKTIPFYEDVLGLQLALDQGSCRIYHTVGRKAYIGICERESAPEKPQGIILTIVTQDVDGWYAQITGKGVACDGEPRMNESYGIYHFFCHDPNGYLIEIQRFASENWDISR